MSHNKVGESQVVQESKGPPEYLFGWSFCRPRCLQKLFNNAKAFLTLMALANITQGIVENGILKVGITSIERRFNLLSSESGLIVSGYDIAGCISLLPISYLGGRGHKPRWIGWGLVSASVGSFVLALPHFLSGPYEYKINSNNGASEPNSIAGNVSISDLCASSMPEIAGGMHHGNSSECEGVPRTLVSLFSLKQMKYVFLFGQFLIGMGSTPLSVLGVTFIDESVDPQVYPIYIGIYYMGALIGPAIGFILGGQLLKLFTEISSTPDITPESPQWVGAWWLGFIIGAAGLFVVAVLILAYPRKLPSTFTRKETLVNIKSAQYGRTDETFAVDFEDAPLKQINHKLQVEHALPLRNDSDASHSNKSSNRDVEVRRPGHWLRCELAQKFFRDVVQVLTNKAFLFLSLSAAVLGTLVSGFSTFGPKYIESQFGKSASDAANLFGYVVIPAGAGGMLLGSVAMSGLKLEYKSALRMCFCVSLLGLFAQFSLTLHCDDVSIAGVNVPYKSLSSSSSDESQVTAQHHCNSACACLPDTFEPVCGSDNVTYYSPCFAGCSQLVDGPLGLIYTNCSCVVSPVTTTMDEKLTNVTLQGVSSRGSAKPRKCLQVCSWQHVILAGLFLVILTTFMCAVPGVDLSLRCFPFHLRSLAIGIQWVLIRTLGTIPGPIIFGYVIDGTCQIWSRTDACNPGLGSCMMYRNQELSFGMLILSFIYKGASILFFGFAMLTYKPAKLLEVKENDAGASRVRESPL